MWPWRGQNSANVFYSNLQHIPASFCSFQRVPRENTCIQSCLSSQTHFRCTLSCISECQRPTGWHQLSRHLMPEPVTRPGSQVFHPIYLSLLPTTRHTEMDTKMRLHIDSGSNNSQARRGLSPASSFHFLYARERETAWDGTGDNVSRQKSIFCSHPLPLSKSAILMVSLNVTSGSNGHEQSKKKAKVGKNWSYLILEILQ